MLKNELIVCLSTINKLIIYLINITYHAMSFGRSIFILFRVTDRSNLLYLVNNAQSDKHRIKQRNLKESLY